jgi:hypothetical protein
MNEDSTLDLVRQARSIADDVSHVARQMHVPPGVGSLALAVQLLAEAVERIVAEHGA